MIFGKTERWDRLSITIRGVAALLGILELLFAWLGLSFVYEQGLSAENFAFAAAGVCAVVMGLAFVLAAVSGRSPNIRWRRLPADEHGSNEVASSPRRT